MADETIPAQPHRLAQLQSKESWFKTRYGLRAALCVLNIIAIGATAAVVASNRRSDLSRDDVDFYDALSLNLYVAILEYAAFFYPWSEFGPLCAGILTVLCLSFLWSALSVGIPFVLKPPRPLHPGIAVAFDLLLWLSFIVIGIFTSVDLYVMTSYGNNPDYLNSISTGSGHYYLAPNNTWIWQNENATPTYYSPTTTTTSFSTTSTSTYDDGSYDIDAYLDGSDAGRPAGGLLGSHNGYRDGSNISYTWNNPYDDSVLDYGQYNLTSSTDQTLYEIEYARGYRDGYYLGYVDGYQYGWSCGAASIDSSYVASQYDCSGFSASLTSTPSSTFETLSSTLVKRTPEPTLTATSTTILSRADATIGADSDDNSSGRSCFSYTSTLCDQEDNLVNQIWHAKSRLVGVIALINVIEWLNAILHFVLFIWACRQVQEINQRTEASRQDQLVKHFFTDLERRGFTVVPEGMVEVNQTVRKDSIRSGRAVNSSTAGVGAGTTAAAVVDANANANAQPQPTHAL